MSLFTTLTEERLCFEISSAKRHVVLAAPGISVKVADALLQANNRLSKWNIQVVLDVSAKVARLGYGDHESVVRLMNAGISIRCHDGLRIGVLICDENGWSFAMSPSLVEAAPSEDCDAFNAIVLTVEQIAGLRSELPLIATEDVRDPILKNVVVGKEPVGELIVKKVSHALDIAPPQKFNLARQTQVYTSLIQFVELKFEGFNIQSRRVQLPESLPIIASKEKAIKDRLTASLKVLDQVQKPKDLQEITTRLNDLREAYLVPVRAYGRIMLKSKQDSFEKELKAIEDTLTICKKTLAIDLQKTLNLVVDEIVPDLTRAVMANPPPRFRGLFSTTEESAAEFVRDELHKTFPKAEDLVDGMKISKFYKDVTYQTLKNNEFTDLVGKLIPKSVLDGSLLKEELAVPSGTVML